MTKEGDWGASAYDKTSSKGTLNEAGGSFSGKAGYMGDGGGSANFSIFAVIFDSTSVETANNYMIAQNSEGNQVLRLATAQGYDTVNLDWGSQANNSWNAVPEPTSGLLLLVGLSALALKRKRARKASAKTFGGIPATKRPVRVRGRAFAFRVAKADNLIRLRLSPSDAWAEAVASCCCRFASEI